MLKPGDREHLIELLRPPVGCCLDFAVGTTFSLDLVSALLLPLSFAFCDWQKPDGELAADPLALLEALRRYGDKYAVFCQSGQIRLPAKYPPLVTFLEQSIYGVQPPDEQGVFHPKVWALRFQEGDASVRYRVLCLSRNLTFDRSWDTAVILDGVLTERELAFAANHPLADLIGALPELALRPLTRAHAAGVARLSDELRRVRFDVPKPFKALAFWTGGLEGLPTRAFEQAARKSLIIAPFLSNDVVKGFQDLSSETHVVSRLEALQELPPSTLQACKSAFQLLPDLQSESEDDTLPREEVLESLEGLHAKVFVRDQGWESHVFSGSFNATNHALRHNVEFMVQLTGPRSDVGVDVLLRQVQGELLFADLLKPYEAATVSVAPDPALRQFDDLVRVAKRAISVAGGRVVVATGQEPDRFDVAIVWKAPSILPNEIDAKARLITLPPDRALDLSAPLSFRAVSFEGLTPLLGIEITAKLNGKPMTCEFVLDLPMEGAPEDRQDRVLRSMISSREQLLRYILFLLAAGDGGELSSHHIQQLIRDGTGAQSSKTMAETRLVETMLRALHRSPDQLERVNSVIDVLRRESTSSALLSAEFNQIWEPIWQTAERARNT
ncbi:phospholipase D family protein [Hyphomicrobium facile]|uniref:PLD phosphodiesterase domain-containing protein n=1 Tax=Hyphomicrobium facile TaxID=51670 RepID=A0A1I7N433_9HYPH|nr:phospholipase D family protein [Hyphomicrobium facile]SFV29427.1 hypothetical protein SAMN04488557_1249 [Hyphomicrobium facile]